MDKTASKPIPNRCWTSPPRPADPNAEQKRLERANDPMLLEAARTYKPSPETLAELRKYEHRPPSAEVMWMVLS